MGTDERRELLEDICVVVHLFVIPVIFLRDSASRLFSIYDWNKNTASIALQVKHIVSLLLHLVLDIVSLITDKLHRKEVIP